MATYKGIAKNLKKESDKLIRAHVPDAREIGNRQAHIEEEMRKLEQLAAVRRHNLEESKRLHEYIRESGELEEWINEQLQLAASEDYGEDYEHLQVSSEPVPEILGNLDDGAIITSFKWISYYVFGLVWVLECTNLK